MALNGAIAFSAPLVVGLRTGVTLSSRVGRHVLPKVAAEKRSKLTVRMAAPVATSSGVTALAAALPPQVRPVLLGLAVLVALVAVVKRVLDTPARAYKGSFDGVGAEYDKWTREGILEYYWGEHIHLGYYSLEEQKRGAFKKDFKKAKIEFTMQMLYWTGVKAPKRILDVGCGIGGTSRILAKEFPHAQVIGISLSKEQIERATSLAERDGLDNVSFQLMDALNMDFEDDQFDLVWGCESGEHCSSGAREALVFICPRDK